MLNKSWWNNIIYHTSMGEYWAAFNIIFRKSSSLKVFPEIGIFSEFILENYFAKYLESSIVHSQSKI